MISTPPQCVNSLLASYDRRQRSESTYSWMGLSACRTNGVTKKKHHHLELHNIDSIDPLAFIDCPYVIPRPMAAGDSTGPW